MTGNMTLADLGRTVRAAGGSCWALEYAEALLEKINRLEAVSECTSLLTQLRAAKDPGDFLGRVLEVNFADLLVRRGIKLRYEAKQGGSGNIDFCWCVSGRQVFIEMKRLGQDKRTKNQVKQQLNDNGCSAVLISDDTRDVARIQRDIFEKSTTKKFNPKPDPCWVNLVAVDVSELQLGAVYVGDCLLAAGGSELVKNYCHPAVHRQAVVGVFEPRRELYTAEQMRWMADYHPPASACAHHPRDYIHGILFLFRKPDESAALSYELSAFVAWNGTLIKHSQSAPVLEAFHQIVPQAEFKS